MAEAKKEKMVDVFLIPRYEGETQRYVAINNRDFIVQTGVQVSVPECVAICLQESDVQRKEAKAKQDEMSLD